MPAAPVGLPVWAVGVWADTVWESGVWASAGAAAGNAILDLNTRLHRFLNDFYNTSTDKDTNALMNKYLAEEKTGDYTNRMKQLIDDATA